nr:helitron helicase-like domain-containing protein [Tanacetum cinerariifolium]
MPSSCWRLLKRDLVGMLPQRNLLKQQFENFSAPSTKMLDQTFDRLQKLVSQLELLGKKLSQEDANQKLLRSFSLDEIHMLCCWRLLKRDLVGMLPQRNLLKQQFENFSAPSTKMLDQTFDRLQKLADLETMSMDDLYKNLKVYKPEVKGMLSSNSSIQNMAFVSSSNNSSTNGVVNTTQAVNTTNGVSTASTQVNAAFSSNSDNLSDAEEGPNYTLMAYTSSSSNSKENLQIDLQDKRMIDSRCSRHMTRNMSYFTDYEVYAASIATTDSVAATITIDEITLAKALVKIKASKPNVKRIFIQEPNKLKLVWFYFSFIVFNSVLVIVIGSFSLNTLLKRRMHHFGGLDESTLNPYIIEGLIHVLDEHNGLVRLFRTARDRCNASDIPSFKIRLYNMGGVRGYELPTTDVLGAIVFENGPRTRTDFNLIIKLRGGPPQRINKLHQSYMLLQFPLLFIFGQPGFYPKLTLKPHDGRGRGKKGEREGIAAGLKIMLPSPFTRGPQYMYSYYLDALVICRSLRNSQIFITLTCNVKWPEIKRYMEQYPELTPTDRAVIVFLYTKEFQKTGWPHCHMLLWVDSKNTLKDAPQIDDYISAEIPDPVQDPRRYKLVTKVMMHGPCGAVNLGPDRILAKISNSKVSTSVVSTTKQIDEIQNYADGRFIYPYEACWRIFDFPIHCREPAVQILNVHLEDMQRINFRKRDRRFMQQHKNDYPMSDYEVDRSTDYHRNKS